MSGSDMLLLMASLMVLLGVVTSGHIRHPRSQSPNCQDPSWLQHFTFQEGVHESFLVLGNHNAPSSDILVFTNIRRSNLTHATCTLTSYSDEHPSLGSTCPTRVVLNYDANRRPQQLYERQCTCNENRKCLRSHENSKCMPVYYYVRVLRKTGCENGVFIYEPAIEPITVGCTCGVPISNS